MDELTISPSTTLSMFVICSNESFNFNLQQGLIARQTSSAVSSLSGAGGGAGGGAAQGTELPLDPFLSGLSEHQRQESADSGLGMAVSQPYSMPHTPEDFLAGMDDRMDCHSDAGASLDADMALADATDDLVPSLQVCIFERNIFVRKIKSVKKNKNN